MASPSPHRDGKFPTTEWTLIARLKNENSATSTKALNDLCAQYHFPLYCFIRQRGLAHHDAEDALHDFLAKLLRLDAFDGLGEEKGRLRTFLSKSLNRFLINRYRREHKREQREMPMDDVHFTLDPTIEHRYEREAVRMTEAPDVIFDRQWCEQLLQRVLALLEAKYEGRGKAALFATLRPVLLAGGSLRGHDSAALATKLGLTNEALRAALLRLLRDYRALLEQEVAQTVESSSEVKAEVEYLTSIVSRR